VDGDPRNKRIHGRLQSGAACVLVRWDRSVLPVLRAQDLMRRSVVKPNCYECGHRREIAGDMHSMCDNHLATVKGNPVGIRNGWFAWPFNFDPVWLLWCSGFVQKAKEVSGE